VVSVRIDSGTTVGTAVSQGALIRVDLTAAAPTVALTTDSGAASDKITNTATLTVAGTEAGAAVQYSATGTGDWTATAPAAVQGANSVYVRQTDIAGNVSSATKFDFTFDSVAPTAPGLKLTTDTGVSTDNISYLVTLATSATESGALVEYSATGNGSWSSTAPVAVEGSNTVYVRQTDTAGNV